MAKFISPTFSLQHIVFKRKGLGAANATVPSQGECPTFASDSVDFGFKLVLFEKKKKKKKKKKKRQDHSSNFDVIVSLTYNCGLQIYKDRPRHVFASSCLTEERIEGVISTTNGLVTGHLAIRLNPVLQTVQLPAGIANLDTCLAHVDTDTLTLNHKKIGV